MLILKTPQELLFEIAARARQCRLELNLTQLGLSKRSGVTLASLKRFERTGEISLSSLLKLAIILENLDSFEALFSQQCSKITLDEIIKTKHIPKRGRIQ